MTDFYRASLLEKEAYILKEKYIKNCKRCGGRGRILTDKYSLENFSFVTFPCRCRRKYIYVLDMLIAGLTEAEALEVLSKDIIDLKVVEVDLATNELIKNKYLYRDYLWPYTHNLDEVCKNGYSFMFIGTNGTGKTFASNYVIHWFLRKCKSAHFIKMRKLMKLVNKSIAGSGQEKINAERMLYEILRVDLLVLDELGRETGNREHISGEIDEILKDRDMSKLSTIVISNRDIDDIESLYEGGKSAIVSAFMRNYKALIFDPDNDFRKANRLENKEWFKK